ncbi:hypothetical protein GQX73_g4091 [Xylaria multiplex]|uniref:AAA+ ATPase domain-containing protein n=1 Tax=Xylaria multiplex TaxID=323545 RepID=A0A7C8IRN5_9PEZI|nr:hypothetical protein GQX73_g4091 [Xylaria multiplex]
MEEFDSGFLSVLAAKAVIDAAKHKESKDIERAIQASLEDLDSPLESTSNGKDAAKAESSRSASKQPRVDSGDDLHDNSSKRARYTRLSIMGSSGSNTEGNNDDLKRYAIEPESITTTVADVHLDKNALEALDALMLSFHDPSAFTFGILANSSPQGVLLYGPPGTGKTLLVRAFAKRTHATTLTLSSADVRSKFVGEGERKIQRIFAYARQHHPCVIFIDEADALFHSRSAQNNSPGHVEDINQFLEEMDGIKSNGSHNPVVIAATNRPFDIDEGILRRLTRRIMIDMPDAAARDHILQIHLRGEKLADDVVVAELVKVTQGYAGSDIKALVYAAAILAVRENLLGTTTGTSLWTWTTAPPMISSGNPRVLNMAHFLRAKQEIRPSPKYDTTTRIQEFHNKFGGITQRVFPVDDIPGPSGKGKGLECM